MGVVYRAKDFHLGREVALKVLPEGLTSDPERAARFEREAKLLASLNHPNIAQVFGLEIEGDIRALVMELVEGPTLAERLERGSLPPDECLSVARQIAEALEAAHAKGIVHRDLKPANVKLSPGGRVKLLDFGLAKASGALPAASASALAEAPTEATPGTRAGAILGTAGYMAPEQVRGQAVDGRADIFSFGCVLFEMLTGRAPFARPTAIETLTAILRDAPPPLATPHGASAVGLERLVARCLEKDAARRFASMRDLVRELESLASAHRPAERLLRSRRRAIQVAVALGAVAALALLLALRQRGVGGGERAVRLSQLTTARGLEESPALSADGTRLVFAERRGAVRGLRLLEIASGESRELTSSDHDELQPAWFPDGGRLLFVRAREAHRRLEPGDIFGAFDGGDVWELDLASGGETLRVENAFHPAVSPDGRRIAVDASWAGGDRIWVLDANGSNPRQVTRDDSEAISHLRPRWSPDGRRLVFLVQERTNFDVRTVDVESLEMREVTRDPYQDVDPVWSPEGDAIYFSSHRSGGLNLWRQTVGRDGRPAGLARQVTTGAGQDVELTFGGRGSPGVFAIRRQNADLWRLPLDPQSGEAAGEPAELIASTREDSRGSWSPDGGRIAFNSDRGGEMNLWVVELTSGAQRQLTTGEGGDFQPAWSPDGRRLVFFSTRAGSVDLWSVAAEGGDPVRLTDAPGMEINPSFSPDGSRIAYQSDASGRLELWIAAADGSSPRQLTESGVGGHFLRWRRDGEAILFRCLCGGRFVVAEVAASGGALRELPWVKGGSHLSVPSGDGRVYDVDGHKTLWVSPLAAGEARALYELPNPEDRIDYPAVSPDGRWLLFDRFRPEDGDLWRLEVER